MRSPISIAFCATGRSGLGHLRRIANIAEAIKRTGHASRLTLVTNAETAALSQEESNHFASIEVCERSRMAMAMSALRPDIAVVDTAIGRVPGCGVGDVGGVARSEASSRAQRNAA